MDASGNYGCGAVWEDQWLQHQWGPSYQEESITPKELVPIVMACAVWGQLWKGKVVHFHCDNQAVVQVVNSGYSKLPQVQHLLRCLFFFTSYFDTLIHAAHISGVENTMADAVS